MGTTNNDINNGSWRRGIKPEGERMNNNQPRLSNTQTPLLCLNENYSSFGGALNNHGDGPILAHKSIQARTPPNLFHNEAFFTSSQNLHLLKGFAETAETERVRGKKPPMEGNWKCRSCLRANNIFFGFIFPSHASATSTAYRQHGWWKAKEIQERRPYKMWHDPYNRRC